MKYNTTEVAKLQPDYLGFIFYGKSPRHFEGAIPKLPESIKKVGVFVDENIEIIVNLVEKYQLDAIQLHGHESPEYCAKLIALCHVEQSEISHNSMPKSQGAFRNENTIEIIKVFSIKDKFDFSVLKPYEDVVDYFLFDTKGELPGGNGYAFNWDVLKDYPSTKPYFLSGGIGLDDIDSVLSFLRPRAANSFSGGARQASKYCYAIDVNSKFEIEPGLKHIDELEQFKNEICHVERM